MIPEKRKNIDINISDVKIPEGSGISTPKVSEKNRDEIVTSFLEKNNGAAHDNKEEIVKRKKRNKVFWLVSFLFVVAFSIYAFNVFNFRERAFDSVSIVYGKYMEAINSLANLQPGEAKNSFVSADAELKNVKSQADGYGISGISQLLGLAIPQIKEISVAFSGMQNLVAASIDLSQNFNDLKNNAAVFFLDKRGGELITLLEKIKNNLDVVNKESEGLAKLTLSKEIVPHSFGDYIFLKSNFYEGYDFLNSLINLLRSPEGAHFAVLLENPSEMRATGGFVGSYADLTITNGSLANLEVHDILDASNHGLKIIPPKPIQTFAKGWTTQDANWFFDFEKSAEKTIIFLDQARLINGQKTSLDGAIGINAEFIGNLLEITGPINLPKASLVLNSDNFLSEVQNDIEQARYKKSQNPKRVLEEIAPILIEKIKSMNESDKSRFWSLFKKSAEDKDIVFYFKDNTIERFLTKLNLTGKVFSSLPGLNNDYLAVVNSNLASGKTDIFINQMIDFKSQIDVSGKIVNELDIVREHHGDSEKYWWYRTENKDYLRVLVPTNMKLLASSGGKEFSVNPPINYEKNGYQADQDVLAIEKNGEESGKSIFATLLNTAAGKISKASFSYESKKDINVNDGAKYKFIFDGQPGVKGGVNIEIGAPPGYRWEEAESVVYRYQANQSPGRLLVDLTMRKI